MSSATAENNKGSMLNLLFRIAISAGLISWLGFTIDWNQLLNVVRESSLLYIVIGFVAIQLTVFASIWKWKLLVDASTQKAEQNVDTVTLGRYYYIGLFFNNFLPSSVGGDIVRIFKLGRKIGMSSSATSVAVERLTSGAALVLILLISALLYENARPFLGSIVVLSLLFILIFAVLWFLMKKSEKRNGVVETEQSSTLVKWQTKVVDSFIKVGDTIRQYRTQGWKWWGAVAILSFMFQIGLVWINDLLFIALNMELPWLELLVVITLISALTMLPISINGIGVREVSYVFFFNQLGVPNEIAVSVSLLFFILVSISSLIGGLFWLSERRTNHEIIRESVH